jgi:outer membrane protein TolC
MTPIRKTRVSRLVALLALLITSGCAVGPNFKRPVAPNVPGYTPSPPTTTSSSPNVTGGEAQTFAQGRDIPGDWWTLFHSKPLNDLIERSLKNNPDLKSAQAALLVARENTLAQRGAYYPQVSGSFSATRAKTSEEISPVPSFTAFQYSLFTPEVSVS